MSFEPVNPTAIRPGSPAVRPAPPRRRAAGRLLAVIGASICLAGSSASATDAAPASAQRSLDEQVQEIKSDVLAIAAELDVLEEKLLYPTHTQVAVFVSIEGDDEVALDSARISIDGELVSHHVYTYKELEALGHGGVQRIYTGNVRTGDHRIEVELRGRRGGDAPFEIVEAGRFAKQKEPARVGITLRPKGGDAPGISIEDW